MNWQSLEEKWQDKWQQMRLFESDPDDSPKRTITVAYPYPNSPQHLGHGRTYTLADINARFWRMRGYNVLFPMGFHYTGTPILGMARRVAAKDAEILEGLAGIYKVPPHIIDTFTDPLNIADYFSAEIEQGMKEMGYSIDWRRRFTTIHPAYQKFVEWQIGALHRKRLIRRGSHPVGWCPRDNNPVSQHDTLGDVEPEFTEYVIVKFIWEKFVLPAATLRPETIFGVTNVWVNPDIRYQIWNVDQEKWIITEQCAQKLLHQGRKMRHIGDIPSSEILGAMVESPAGDTIPVLPAGFVDPDTGSGIVMSVPAHAPHDHAALRLIDPDGVIPSQQVISTPGYGPYPAAEACEGLDLGDHDALEEATGTLYNREFYAGVMCNCRYEGMKVAECRDKVRQWLLDVGSIIMMEMANEVRCRCGTLCVVHVLKKQWFLNYGSQEWKDSARGCLDEMEILPQEIRGEFYNVIDWLRERTCARQQGLGTPLPWDPGWIVESLTDSTIYTAFYTIMKFVQNGTITPDMMDRRFFEYVFYARGTPPAHAKEVRHEFLYYYPVDTRHSGRDLVPNHLTFYVMNHTALFPKKDWPEQIVVNGSVLMHGKKMSKSMGNIIPLRSAIKKYGADPIRLGIAISAELLQDADIDTDSFSGIGARLQKMMQDYHGMSLRYSGGTWREQCESEPGGKCTEQEDMWFKSRIQHIVQTVTKNIEGMRVREALHDILYTMERDMQWYNRRLAARKRRMPPSVELMVYGVRVRLLAPFAPHAAEEMWEALGNDRPVSISEWPKAGTIHHHAMHDEEYLVSVLHDIIRIVKVTGTTPSHIHVYAAGSHHMYDTVLQCVDDGAADMRSVMARLGEDADRRRLREHPKEIAACLKDILSENSQTRKARLDRSMPERDMLEAHLQDVVRTEYDCMVTIHDSGDVSAANDPRGKARTARAYHPAIYIE